MVNKFVLKAPYSLYLFYAVLLGALAVFLFYVGAMEGFYAVVTFVIFLFFFTSNVQVKVTDTTLVIQNKYRRQKIIQFNNISLISQLMGVSSPDYIPIQDVPQGLAVTLKSGEIVTISLTMYDIKDIHTFLSLLSGLLPENSFDANIKKDIVSKTYIKASKRAVFGILVSVVGIVGFFISGNKLGYFGRKIVFNSLDDVIAIVVPLSFLVLSFFGIGYMVEGKKTGVRLIEYFLLTFVIFGLLGWMFIWD